MLLLVRAKHTFFKILYTKYTEKSETMTSSTHSFAYSYRLFKKCSVENYEISKCHIPSIFFSSPSYIKFSLFCANCFNLSIELT